MSGLSIRSFTYNAASGSDGLTLVDFLLGIIVTAVIFVSIYFYFGFNSQQGKRWLVENKFWIISTYAVSIGLIIILSLYKTGLLGLEGFENNDEEKTY